MHRMVGHNGCPHVQVRSRHLSPEGTHSPPRSVRILFTRHTHDFAIDLMRRVKAALDPEWKLAPGVIFSPK